MASQDWLEKDFYAVLGVDSGISDSELRKVYRKLARKYHPDSNPGSAEAESRFKEVSEAYTVLSDPQQREEYDQLRSQKTTFTAGDFGDVFSNLFNNFGGGTSFTASMPGEDLSAAVKVDLETAVMGDSVNLRMAGGETVRVKIPAGIGDGQRFRVKGKGAPSPYGGPKGDLLVKVSIRRHPIFELDGKNLRMNLAITFAEAYNGAVIEIPTMGKKQVKIRIQPGTPSGRVLRVRGKGVQDPADPGDLLAVVQIVPPDTDNEEIRAIMEQLAEKTKGENPRQALFDHL